MALTDSQVQDAIIELFKLIGVSRLPSELQTIAKPPTKDHYLHIQKGEADGERITVEWLRGALGAYNATTNTPILQNGTGTEGDSYIVSAAGARDFGNGLINLSIDDVLAYRNGKWVRTGFALTKQTILDTLGFIPEDTANRGITYPTLDENRKVPISQTYGGTSEVIEGEYIDPVTFNDDTGTPVTPTKSVIYLDKVQVPNAQYRWGGTQFIKTIQNPGSTDEVAEGDLNLYFTTARVLETLLTGLSTANVPINSADTAITALGKLQGQISALAEAIATSTDFTIQREPDFASFPLEGFEDTLYVDEAENKAYLWDDFEGLYFEFGGGTELTLAALDAVYGYRAADEYILDRAGWAMEDSLSFSYLFITDTVADDYSNIGNLPAVNYILQKTDGSLRFAVKEGGNDAALSNAEGVFFRLFNRNSTFDTNLQEDIYKQGRIGPEEFSTVVGGFTWKVYPFTKLGNVNSWNFLESQYALNFWRDRSANAEVTAQAITDALGGTPALDSEVVKSVNTSDGTPLPKIDGVVTLPPIEAGFNFNNLTIPYGTTPIIEPGVMGEWDENIREIGNVVFDGSQYIITYTGHTTPKNEAEVYVGLATSSDKINWVKQGKIINTPSEDPYLVFNNDSYYLYVEKKSDSFSKHDGIELFTSDDLDTWVSQGVVLDKGGAGEWDLSDVSSPIVFINEGTWYMFFEGRAFSAQGYSFNQEGAIGLATSIDGISWAKQSNPIFSGTNLNGDIQWASHIVPDDIIKREDSFFMTSHAFNGQEFVAAILHSYDLLNWTDYLGTWLTTSTDNNDYSGAGLMFGGDFGSAIHMQDGSIFLGLFNNKNTDEWKYQNKVSSLYPVISGGRNEIIDVSITTDTTFKLGSDLSSRRGVSKIFKNDSGFTLTITADTGATIEGGNYILPTGYSAWFISIDSSTWKIFQEFTSNSDNTFLLTPEAGIDEWTVTRNSEATYLDENGIFNTVSVNKERIDFTNGDPAILVEGASMNLIPNSITAPFMGGVVKDGAAISLFSAIHPAELTYNFPSSSGTLRYILFTTSLETFTEYTLSVFIEMHDGLPPSPGSSVSSTNYDFAIVIENAGSSSYNVEHITGNIYRVSGTRTTDGAINNTHGVYKYAGQSAKGFKVLGFQLETGPRATTYIPTSGAMKTRQADVITITPPTGTTLIKQTVDGVLTEVINIPSTYQLPIGYVERVEGLKGEGITEIQLKETARTFTATQTFTNTAGIKEHQINGTRQTANITGTFNFDWNAYSQFVLTPTGAVTLGNATGTLPVSPDTKVISGIFKASAFAVTFPANWKAKANNDPLSDTLDTHFTAETFPDYVLYTLENIPA